MKHLVYVAVIFTGLLIDYVYDADSAKEKHK